MEDEFDIPKVSDLKLTGFELMQMGFNGKEIGNVKKYLLSEVLDNGIPNDKEILREIVKDKFLEKENHLSYETECEI